MKQNIYLLICKVSIFGIGLLFASFDVGGAERDAPWKAVLAAFVDDEGLVDYQSLKQDAGNLTAYVDRLAKTGPQATPGFFITRADSFAFWLNAYNAFVLYGVVQAYPVGSVREILPEFGFFKQKKFRIDGRDLTLDEIEHTILRAYFKDPRIHAAVNCAAISCPKLRNKPFQAKILDLQLEQGMRQMIQSVEHVHLDSENKILYLSKIFDWFQSDFSDGFKNDKMKKDVSYLDYLTGFLTAEQRQVLEQTPNIEIVFKEYDWTLNDRSVKK